MKWLAAVALMSLAGCQHGSARPGPAAPALARGRFSSIEVTAAASHRTAAVPAELQAGLNPLLIARTIDVPSALGDYGLDQPQAAVTYRQGDAAAIVITVGSPNFDRRGLYVQRGGDRRVYLVLAEAVRPVLALVGVVVAAPASG